MKRTNFYLTNRQMERLKQRSEDEGLSLAELVRRAVDAFLAWDDPTSHPTAHTAQKERALHTHVSSAGADRGAALGKLEFLELEYHLSRRG